MLVDHYPLFGLRLCTPRLELRLAQPEELAALADVAAQGVHDPAVMPFVFPWTDAEPAVRARSVVQHYWKRLGDSTPEAWGLVLTVFRDGAPVGIQQIGAQHFAVVREVATGSWLGQRYQRQGIGTEMRAAVLHLAFEGLGAQYALSAAFLDNVGSAKVSRTLGYQPDGVERHLVRGGVVTSQRLRLDRAGWEKHRTVPVTVTGLTPECLAQLGAG
jgi:RimJ/RimL family protein N-acetyltransferase